MSRSRSGAIDATKAIKVHEINNGALVNVAEVVANIIDERKNPSTNVNISASSEENPAATKTKKTVTFQIS